MKRLFWLTAAIVLAGLPGQRAAPGVGVVPDPPQEARTSSPSSSKLSARARQKALRPLCVVSSRSAENVACLGKIQ